jgi:hypothetical protein
MGKNVVVGTTSGVSTLGDLAVMRRRAARGELHAAEVEMLFAELHRLRAAEESLEARRCKLHHILGALAAHFSSRATPASP